MLLRQGVHPKVVQERLGNGFRPPQPDVFNPTNQCLKACGSLSPCKVTLTLSGLRSGSLKFGRLVTAKGKVTANSKVTANCPFSPGHFWIPWCRSVLIRVVCVAHPVGSATTSAARIDQICRR
jgi:hypothetical protein